MIGHLAPQRVMHEEFGQEMMGKTSSSPLVSKQFANWRITIEIIGGNSTINGPFSIANFNKLPEDKQKRHPLGGGGLAEDVSGNTFQEARCVFIISYPMVHMYGHHVCT